MSEIDGSEELLQYMRQYIGLAGEVFSTAGKVVGGIENAVTMFRQSSDANYAKYQAEGFKFGRAAFHLLRTMFAHQVKTETDVKFSSTAAEEKKVMEQSFINKVCELPGDGDKIGFGVPDSVYNDFCEYMSNHGKPGFVSLDCATQEGKLGDFKLVIMDSSDMKTAMTFLDSKGIHLDGDTCISLDKDFVSRLRTMMEKVMENGERKIQEEISDPHSRQVVSSQAVLEQSSDESLDQGLVYANGRDVDKAFGKDINEIVNGNDDFLVMNREELTGSFTDPSVPGLKTETAERLANSNSLSGITGAGSRTVPRALCNKEFSQKVTNVLAGKDQVLPLYSDKDKNSKLEWFVDNVSGDKNEWHQGKVCDDNVVDITGFSDTSKNVIKNSTDPKYNVYTVSDGKDTRTYVGFSNDDNEISSLYRCLSDPSNTKEMNDKPVERIMEGQVIGDPHKLREKLEKAQNIPDKAVQKEGVSGHQRINSQVNRRTMDKLKNDISDNKDPGVKPSLKNESPDMNKASVQVVNELNKSTKVIDRGLNSM